MRIVRSQSSISETSESWTLFYKTKDLIYVSETKGTHLKLIENLENWRNALEYGQVLKNIKVKPFMFE